ncbi:protein ECERIFERUM 16 [Salvia hispanica]|uniref:protein ECERIFERUM 16 n=1 Tax=Salvia hispanica TaxID=49212 RepID=UPI0020094FE5|nr:protein ECERIFERUM 16 [Salvia hispanica]
MDSKALAKSKRAHSLHHKKKHHSHHGSKVPSPSVGSDAAKKTSEGPEKSQGQQTKERTPQRQGSRALPSNWNRYDDDEDLDSASGNAQASSSQLAEFVMPKSKGAGYAHMISEAKAQSQPHYSSDDLPLLDDFIGDFMQDFGPMLAAKGQSMLSWTADDSFEFEDKASIAPQPPFLSLNLDALAEQLAKAKLSERLYLQSDLLLVEQLDEACDEDEHNPQTLASSSSLTNDQAVTTTGDLLVQTSEEPYPTKKTTDQILQPQATNRSISPKPVSEHPADSSSGKPSTFEAATAEAELDMLLNSFGEAPVPEESGGSIPLTGDAVDILIEETSSFTIADQQIPQVSKAHIATISSSKNPTSKSEFFDDFDSWLDTI